MCRVQHKHQTGVYDGCRMPIDSTLRIDTTAGRQKALLSLFSVCAVHVRRRHTQAYTTPVLWWHWLAALSSPRRISLSHRFLLHPWLCVCVWHSLQTLDGFVGFVRYPAARVSSVDVRVRWCHVTISIVRRDFSVRLHMNIFIVISYNVRSTSFGDCVVSTLGVCCLGWMRKSW